MDALELPLTVTAWLFVGVLILIMLFIVVLTFCLVVNMVQTKKADKRRERLAEVKRGQS